MICDDCKHVIFRTYRNGPNEEYYRWSCDIDGKENPPQLHACGRKEEKEIVVEEVKQPELVVIEPKECLHHATLAAGGTLSRDGICVVCKENIPELSTKKRGRRAK